MRQSSYADTVATFFQTDHETYGISITVNGKAVSATTRSLSAKEMELVPAGPDANASFADVRVYNLIPAELVAQGLTLTAEMTILDAGRTYTILAVLPPERVGATAVEQSLIAFLTPQGDVTPQDAAQLAQWPAPPQ